MSQKQFDHTNGYMVIYPIAEKRLPIDQFVPALMAFEAERTGGSAGYPNFNDTQRGGWWLVAAPTDATDEVLAVMCKGAPITSENSWKADRDQIIPHADRKAVTQFCLTQGFTPDERAPESRAFLMAELANFPLASTEQFQTFLKDLDEKTAQFTLWYHPEAKLCSVLTDDRSIVSMLDKAAGRTASNAQLVEAKVHLKALVDLLRQHGFAGEHADRLEKAVNACKVSTLTLIEPGKETHVSTVSGVKLDAWHVNPFSSYTAAHVAADVPSWPAWVIRHLALSRTSPHDDFAQPGWLVKMGNGRVLRFREDDFLELFDAAE